MRLEALELSFRYTPKSPMLLRAVSLGVETGERLGIVAPSGYGKSTLVKLLSGHSVPTEGTVCLDGNPLPTKGRSPVQLIHQHPERAINPRWRMRRVLEESGQLDPVVLDGVGIRTEWLSRFPHELSGGEQQRFNVARALCDTTRFLLADEITSMLDVITQAQIWHYLLDESDRREIGLVVITHDQALAERVCTTVIDLPAINGQGES